MKITYYGSSLPNQAVNKKRKKNDTLSKNTVDTLERIAYQQVRENQKYKDYFDMLEGKLVWAHYVEEDISVLEYIKDEFGDSIERPGFVKHYDILGLIVNQVVGEWLNNQDDFHVDCVDEHTENEFLRERKKRLHEYIQERFNLEVQKAIIEGGIGLDNKELTPDEQQMLQQKIEEVKNSIKTPDQIEREMKDWRTQSVSWANGVIENDTVRFRMENLSRKEMLSYACTGKYFRNYFIGFDYYKPESWDVMDVFHSREKDADKPQDREYVGRQLRMPIYQVRERYGHLLTKKELENLDNYFGAQIEGSDTFNLNNEGDLKSAMFGWNKQVPYYNYDDFQGAIEVQELTGTPRGFNIVQTPDGEVAEPYFIPEHDHLGFRNLKSNTRNDYEVRRDTVLVTEGYYRSYKRKYLLKFRDEDGVVRTEIVTDDILPEFISQHGLRQNKNKSLEDVIEDLESDNLLHLFYEPVIRGFIKINIGGNGKGDKNSIYYDDELKYQIRANSELVDVLIPVGGVIDTFSIADKIKPYQIAYNICLNQIIDMMGKELGLFAAFDIRLLPSEIKDYGDTEEVLEKVQEFIKNTSLVPLDYSKGNTGYSSPNSNSFVPQMMSYANDISARMNWAENYKRLAIEQIGMTPQRMGSPDKYETAQGIQQGVEASYAQTQGFFSKMTQSHLQTMEVHLSVAQYCQKNYKDVDFVYTKSDGSKGYVYLSDDNFPLRRFGVFPINSSKNKRRREQLIQTLMQLNTLGADVLDYAEVFLSDSVQEVLDAGKKARIRRLEEQNISMQNERQMQEAELKARADKEAFDREHEAKEKEKDRQNRIRVAQLQALGRASYSESNEDDETINQVADVAQEEAIKQGELEIKKDKIQSDKMLENKKLELEQKKLDIEKNKIEQKRESDRIKENIARINWRQ